MYDQPTAAELIAGVARFLREEVAPALAGRVSFHARVAANVLDTVQRELALGPAAVAGETARLKALLDQDASTAELEDALCAAITDGKVDAQDPALIDHLWATTLDTLAVDQPRYATYRRAVADAPSTPKGGGEVRLSSPAGGSTPEGGDRGWRGEA